MRAKSNVYNIYEKIWKKSNMKNFKYEKFRLWKVSNIKNFKYEKFQIWKLSNMKALKYEKFQFQLCRISFMYNIRNYTPSEIFLAQSFLIPKNVNYPHNQLNQISTRNKIFSISRTCKGQFRLGDTYHILNTESFAFSNLTLNIHSVCVNPLALTFIKTN